MSVGLFTGIETYNWTLKQFDDMINFCKANSVDYVVLKIYEITQGEWYKDLGGAAAIVEHIQNAGLEVRTYGYYYGNDPVTECAAIQKYLGMWGFHIANMEGSFDGNPNNVAETFKNLLNGHIGVLAISTWANPVQHSWTSILQTLDPVVDIWMPECYDDNLTKAMYTQWIHTMSPIQPTFHLQNTPYVDAKSFPNFTLWEYEMATANKVLLENFVLTARGINVGSYPTNSLGMVAYYPLVSEFMPGHSEFECGSYSVALNAWASQKPVPQSVEPGLRWWAENQYKVTTGSNAPSSMAGASIANMHTMFKNTQDYSTPNRLHYWDTNISTTSQQDSDLATIKAALAHGYPVVATVSEASVFDMDLGRNPYWWGATGNHILTWVGVASDGNLLAVDEANVARGDGNLQTTKVPLAWPRRYRASSIDNQWATIVQLPWLPPIPNNNPVSWPPYQPVLPPPPPTPVPVDVAVQVLYDPHANQIIFMKSAEAIYRISLS